MSEPSNIEYLSDLANAFLEEEANCEAWLHKHHYSIWLEWDYFQGTEQEDEE